MSDFKSNFWDERYSFEEYVYGTEPNQFFKEQIDKFSSPGILLMPGEGEGRNAVYAAKLDWQVDAFDQSINAQKKALRLAKKNEKNINYQVTDVTKFYTEKNKYDAAAIIFVHFNSEERTIFHHKIINSLKPGGKLILESFSKSQFGKKSGGPQALEMLYSLEDVMNDFKEIKTILLEEKNVILNEGDKHSGEASVIRYVGEKLK
jgi:cyclopropane fatty-acyl-phospholipid synthase-like methyltransferase